MTTTMAQQVQPDVRAALRGVIDQVRAEQRWLTLMRLVFAGTVLCWLLVFAWLPGGPLDSLMPGDPMPGSVRSVLLLAALFGSVAYWLVWRPSLCQEASSEFVRVLFGAGLMVRSAGQFKSKLALECRRTRGAQGWAVSLIVLKLGAPPERQDGARSFLPDRDFDDKLAALAVRGIARGNDVVASAAPDEVWLLALGAEEYATERIVERLSGRLSGQGSLPAFAGCRIGAATCPADGWKPDGIFQAAYARLAPIESPSKAA